MMPKRNSRPSPRQQGMSGRQQHDDTPIIQHETFGAKQHRQNGQHSALHAVTVLRAAALKYAEQGIPVFPLAPEKKTPLIARQDGGHGYKDATTDCVQVDRWWRHNPTANIGRPTGREYGVLVIEDDPRHDGPASLDALEARYGPLPATYTVRSGGGGHHRYFRHPDQFIKSDDTRFGEQYPGVDVKAEGGYVVAPPSVHPKGPRYFVTVEAPVADLPQAWLDALLATQASPAPERDARPDAASARHRYDDAAAYWLGKALAMTSGGNRNDTAFWLACQLRDARLDQDAAQAVVLDYAQVVEHMDKEPYTESEALASLEQAYSKAPREPARSRASLNGHKRRAEAFRAPPRADGADSDGEAVGDEDGESAEAGKETQAQVLIRIGRTATLFKTPTGALHTRVFVSGHYETWAIAERGGSFRRWLVYQYGMMCGTPPNATALAQAIEALSAEAQFQGETHEVFTRLGYLDGKLYLDLANASWQVVEVSPGGWRVLDEAPVYFRRPASMLPLPLPARGGSLTELRPFINVANDSDWLLIVGWLLGTMHPKGPYPVLALHGERGAAKSSATKRLRRVVDPAAAITRDTPKEARDLAIAAHNNRVIALDNLSSMPIWLSDALCRLAYGAGFSTRALYTDDGEAIFDSTRPVVFNGIEEVATRGDLLDRAIVVQLPAITEDARRTEREIDAAWEHAHPRILGALLDATAAALDNLSRVQFTRRPRMADFAEWVVAAEEALGWPRGSFLAAYDTNRADAVNIEIEAHPVSRALLSLMQTCDRWQGRAADLLSDLGQHATGDDKSLPQWPKAANKLAGTIARLAPSLRAKGIRVSDRRGNNGREYTITRTPEDTPPTPPESDDTQDKVSSLYRHFGPVSSLYRHSANPLDASESDDSDDSDDSFPLYISVADNDKEREKGGEGEAIESSGNLSSLSSLCTRGVEQGYYASDDLSLGQRCGQCGSSLWAHRRDGRPGWVCRSCHCAEAL